MTTRDTNSNDLWRLVRDVLAKEGIDLDLVCQGRPEGQARVICVAASLGEGIQELARSARDQVVMLRVDRESVDALDAWVAAGVAKSRSEAAALFVREGLRLRAGELAALKESLEKVEEARRELQERAKSVLGSNRPDAEGTP